MLPREYCEGQKANEQEEKKILQPDIIDYDKCNVLNHMIRDKYKGILLPEKEVVIF